MPRKPSIEKHHKILEELTKDATYTIFLCGPSFKTEKPSSILRKKIFEALSEENFDVVLGEDEGLEETRLHFGCNAQDNELEFIKQCNAIVIIADSAGSHCELGLFSWHYVHEEGWIFKMDPKPTLIVLTASEFKPYKSYFNEGPIASILTRSYVDYIDYEKYDPAALVKIFKNSRILESQNKRGRPRGAL